MVTENEIKLRGRLDQRNVSEIEKELHEVIKTKEHVVIDLNELEILDISGIFMLFVCKQKAKSQGKDIVYLLSNAKVVSGNEFGIQIPKLI